jgi:GrpB-like predicted nucleotidyltransferase (UPF0157 family)
MKDKYQYMKYSSKFPELFKKEKAKLTKAFPKGTIVEHIGSTAVPGLGGKGIIDIAIKTPRNKVKDYVGMAEKCGFTYKKYPGDKLRKFMDKVIKYSGNERRVHLHLTLTKQFWNSFILFRDYLKENKKAINEYADIKKQAAKHAKGDKKKYWKHKRAVLNKHFKRAMKKPAKA